MPVSKGRLLIVTIWWGKKLVKKRQTTDSHDMVGEKLVKKRKTTDSHDMVGGKLEKKRQTTDSQDMVGETTCEEKGDY
jgi:hypothetical protein